MSVVQNFDFLDFYIKLVKLVQSNSAIAIINKSNLPLYTTEKYKELISHSKDVLTLINQKLNLNCTENYKGMTVDFSDIKDPFNGKSLATIVQIH